MIVVLVWHGPPATKKTSQVIGRRGSRAFILPSRAYQQAAKTAIPEIATQYPHPTSLDRDDTGRLRLVNVRARFYLGARQRPDLSGLLEACGDLLQASGALANDYSIASWDGSRRFRDRDNPRTEVEITPHTED